MTSMRGSDGKSEKSTRTEHTLVSAAAGSTGTTARPGTAANSISAARSGTAANSVAATRSGAATTAVLADTSVQAPTAATASTGPVTAGGRPSRASNTPRSEQALVSDRHPDHEPAYIILDVDDGLDETPEYTFLCRRPPTRGVRRDHVDFVFDSASVSNIMKPEDASLLSQVIDDPVTLIGVGDIEVKSERSGVSVFGKTRIMSQNHNLVSQFEIKRNYKIIEETEDCFRLEPRRDHSSTLKWWFVRDQHRYGDLLLHCTVPRRQFKYAMMPVNEECLNLYYDAPITNESAVSLAERSILERVELLHEDLNHASAKSMSRTIAAHMNAYGVDHLAGVTLADVETWSKMRGARCSGCVRGKLTDHRRRASSATETFAPGEAAGGDIMFVELKDGDSLKPLLITVDIATQLGTVTTLKDRSTDSIYGAISADQMLKKSYGKPIKTLYFDREPSVIAIAAALLENLGIKLEPKAAGQHVGAAERYIRLLKDHCRATKMGVLDKYGYMPPLR